MARKHAFISYVRENKALVDRLATDLRFSGVKVWLDRNDIAPGMNWKIAISEAIRTGAFFIACFSREFSERDVSFMHSELRDALDMLRSMPPNRVWLIPVLLNEARIPDHFISAHEPLRDLHSVKLYEDWGMGVQRILRAMNLEDPAYKDAFHLVDLVRHHVPERAHAISRLKAYSSRPDIASLVAPVVVEALRNTDDAVCNSAMEVLIDFGSAALPALNEALRDKDDALRCRAALVLSKSGLLPYDAIISLIEAMQDPNLRIRAIIALVKIEQSVIDAAIHGADRKERERALAALKEVGIKAGRKDHPGSGWRVWENETHIIIDEDVADEGLRVYKKRPGARWEPPWAKDYFYWWFEYDDNDTPVCVGRQHCSPA